jgi:UDP-N-acetylglucosamine 2-epimerase (non-hydrolysing)
MIDTLFRQLERAKQSSILDSLSLKPQDFGVLTLHRPSNVDDPDSMRRLFTAVGTIASSLAVVFPAHPRTLNRMREFGVEPPPGVRVIEPLGYLDFLKLWSNSRMTLTDSGGLQEETTALGVPCLTLRENTERPITISQGTNHLVGLDPERIVSAAQKILADGRPTHTSAPELWDGRAAQRIVAALLAPRENK